MRVARFAMLAVLQINSVSFMPAFGLATAGAIFVGQAIGAGKKDDVPRTVRLTMITCAVWEGAVGLCYLAIPAVLPGAEEGFLCDVLARRRLERSGTRRSPR